MVSQHAEMFTAYHSENKLNCIVSDVFTADNEQLQPVSGFLNQILLSLLTCESFFDQVLGLFSHRWRLSPAAASHRQSWLLLHQQTAPTMSCPFMSAGIAASLTNSASDISKCPMHAQILAAQQQQEHGAAAPPAAAVCPLGFGSSRGPKLSTLHCPVCKGLLFDAHMSTSCKHTFCHSCLSRTRDCPVCGMDVQGVEPNTELAGGLQMLAVALAAGILHTYVLYCITTYCVGVLVLQQKCVHVHS